MKDRTGIFLIVPTLLVLGTLIAFPVLYTIVISFLSQNILTGATHFAAFRNYARALTSSRFWHSLYVDVAYTVFSVVFQLGLGMFIAILVNQDRPGIPVLRSMLLVPYVVPVIAIALGWRWMLNQSYGIVTFALVKTHVVAAGSSPLSEKFGALATVIIMSIWRGTPFTMVFYWAALKTIPTVLYEAATVDGASKLQQFGAITLPQLRAVTTTLVILRTIWTFNFFDLIYLTTSGGPADATEHLPILIYRESMGKFNFNYAAAISVLMVVILLSLVMTYLNRQKDEI